MTSHRSRSVVNSGTARDTPRRIWRDLDAILAFVGELKQLCDDYFAWQVKSRVTNCEDIAYVARQIDDGIMSEYETRP